jgi:diguanylate cyclase (GGDEF)-like protein/PAS domain S-box-containing protein
MLQAGIPATEQQRLAALMCLHILDTPPEERFDRITRVVATHFQVPIAAVNLIDVDRQWSKSAVGGGTSELPRSISFCAHVVATDDAVVMEDTKADLRSCDNPLVTTDPSLRFYAGVPLRSTDGHALGTLCIADHTPRVLDPGELAVLRDFAAWAERELTTVQLSEALLHQQEIEHSLRVSEARYAAVIAALAEGVISQSADGSIVTCNASAEKILGLTAEQMMGRTSIDPRWRAVRENGTPFPGAEHPAMVALRTGAPQGPIIMGIHKPDGMLSWISITSHPLLLPGGTRPTGVVSSFVDMTQHKEYEQQLTAHQQQLQRHNADLTVLATTDGMTGITNKRTLLERLAAELHVARQTRTPLSLIMLDVDHFKAYNDTHGHLAGDIVLKQVAQLLHTTARTTDIVARYGGEEFVVVLPNTPAERARHVAERLRTVIAQTSVGLCAITASLGVATVQDYRASPDSIIAEADAALYAAKRQGRNMVVSSDAIHVS